MKLAEATIDTKKEPYLADMAKLPADRLAPWMDRIHAAGVARFRQTPFPHARMEEWRQTNLSPVVNTAYRALVLPGAHGVTREQVAPFLYGGGAWTELVFVDGFYAPELSIAPGLPEGVFAGSLALGIEGEGMAVAETHLNQYLGDRNAYTALNTALVQDGALVHIGQDVALDTPIHLLFVTSRRAPESMANIRNLFVLESGSRASVVSSYVSLAEGANYLNNVVDEVALRPNSQLHQYKLVEEGGAGNHLATTEVHQEQDSRMHSFVMSMTGKVTRNQLCVKLDGEGATCNLVGLYLNDDARLIDNALSITHVKPNCFSRIAYKGVLDGKSKSVFTGKVYVHREAQKTDSDQLSNNLMLSDDATIDTKPQLEIYADDVKCTHGATIGAPPEPIIFYFRTRGIDEATARAMLTYGFAEEIVDEIEIDALSARLGKYVYDKYSP